MSSQMIDTIGGLLILGAPVLLFFECLQRMVGNPPPTRWILNKIRVIFRERLIPNKDSFYLKTLFVCFCAYVLLNSIQWKAQVEHVHFFGKREMRRGEWVTIKEDTLNLFQRTYKQ